MRAAYYEKNGSAKDVLHVGGFSDAVFGLLAEFAAGGQAAARWVERIEAIQL